MKKHAEADTGFKVPLHRHTLSPSPDDGNSLYLIRKEITIINKLDHPNIVSLVEVLNDPTDDWLYIVIEICKKGIAIKVRLDEKAYLYNLERDHLWFRDLVLRTEYQMCFMDPDNT